MNHFMHIVVLIYLITELELYMILIEYQNLQKNIRW